MVKAKDQGSNTPNSIKDKTMRDYNLKHREKLLADIAAQLPKLGDRSIFCIRVRLYCGKARRPVAEFEGLDKALTAIVDDLYWDENNNWADADRAHLDIY